ncbi:MAG: hypothetical protein IJS12_05885 [Lachnospiraceae bacterium]|nr:hypothetical protein [Lachnospiraceae bacterium]
MADVKEMIDKVVDKAKSDPKFMDELKKDPEKAIESVIGMDIPDGMVDKVMAAVKSKDTLDKVGGVLNMLKK